ncbi:MAG: hypothetical protein C4321_05155, partial [Chloroflexota bacterium]
GQILAAKRVRPCLSPNDAKANLGTRQRAGTCATLQARGHFLGDGAFPWAGRVGKLDLRAAREAPSALAESSR